MAEEVRKAMPDERDESEQSRELLGTPPPSGATFEEPTGADAVVARDEATITDGGIEKPEKTEE